MESDRSDKSVHDSDASSGKSLDELVALYLGKLNDGECLDRDQILADHPEFGDEILRDLDAFVSMTGAGDESRAGDSSPLGTLGDYTLRRQIGRGGMGVVYDAWENSLDRRVALKVLPPGVAADARSSTRFLREAQIVAKLSHPRIVPVHATGINDGTPWYAMEFVEGETLAQIIGKIKEADPESDTPFGPKEQVDYFAKIGRAFADVADGLQHAHSKGVIHRDIKPSNLILDREQHLRILDFGLAHLDDQESLTTSGEVVGTPLYMSPEQARRKRITVDHRTDLYSLGATMYEALCGRPPFRGKDHADTLSQIIERDPVEPRKLSPRVPKALETIVLKCLRKEPGDRYGTAEALAQDLRRFVRGDPVEAQPQPAWEKWARRVWRYRKAVVSATALLVLAVGGFAVSNFLIWQEKQRTEVALTTADQNLQKARDAVDEMLTEVGQSSLADVPGMEKVRRALLKKALTFYEGFLMQKSSDPGLRFEMGRAYLRVGDIFELLGQHSDAEDAFRKAVDAFDGLAHEFPGEPRHRQYLARSHQELAGLFSETGRDADAKMALGRAKTLLEDLANRSPEETEYLADLASLEQQVGKILAREGKSAEAEGAFRRAVEHGDGLLRDAPANTQYLRDQASRWSDMASVLQHIGNIEGAEESCRSALSHHEKIAGSFAQKPENLSQLASIRKKLGNVLAATGRRAEAVTVFREALEVQRKLAEDFPRVPEYRRELASACLHLATGVVSAEETDDLHEEAIRLTRELASDFPDVPDYRSGLAVALNNYGNWHRGNGRRGEAKELYREAVAVFQRLAEDFPSNPGYRNTLAMFRSNLGTLLLEGGDDEGTEKELREALKHMRTLHEEHPRVHEYRANLARLQNNLGYFFEHRGRLEGAESAYREAVTIQDELVRDSPDVSAYRHVLAKSLLNLAKAHARTGNLEEAEASFERVVTLLRELIRADPKDVGYQEELIFYMKVAAGWREVAGGFPEALEAWRQVLEEQERLVEEIPGEPAYRHDLAESWFKMASVLEEGNRIEKAEEAFREAKRLQKKLLASSPGKAQFKKAVALTRSELGRLLAASKAFEEAEGELRSAEALWEELRVEEPENKGYSRRLLHTLFNLAQCLDHAGRLEDAKEAQRRAASLASGAPALLNLLAWFLATRCTRDGAEATRLAEEAVRLAPEKGAFWNTLGVARYRAGHWKLAVDALEKSMELRSGGDPCDWFFLAMAKWRLGETEEARKSYEEAVEWLEEKGTRDVELRGFQEEAERLLGSHHDKD